MDDAILDVALQGLWRGLFPTLCANGVHEGWGSRSAFCGPARAAASTAVHGGVREAVGPLVFTAEDVLDAEGIELCDAALCLVVERAQIGAGDLVAALDLLDEQLGVADDAQAAMAGVEGPLQRAQQRRIFGDIIGGFAQEFAEFGELLAVGTFDEDAVACWVRDCRGIRRRSMR